MLNIHAFISLYILQFCDKCQLRIILHTLLKAISFLFFVTYFGGLSTHTLGLASQLVDFSLCRLVHPCLILWRSFGVSLPMSKYPDVLYITATVHPYVNRVVAYLTLSCLFLSIHLFIKSYSSLYFFFIYLHVYVHPFICSFFLLWFFD